MKFIRQFLDYHIDFFCRRALHAITSTTGSLQVFMANADLAGRFADKSEFPLKAVDEGRWISIEIMPMLLSSRQE